MSAKKSQNKAKAAPRQPVVSRAQQPGESAPPTPKCPTNVDKLTPSQQTALRHAQDANLDHTVLTAEAINALSDVLKNDPEYTDAVFTLADFNALVDNGLMEVVAGVYVLKNDPLNLTEGERAFILAARVGDWKEAAMPFWSILEHKELTPPPPKPERVSFRAPDPDIPYGYDYGDDIMPHEEIAISVFANLTRYFDIPRKYTVGGEASEFIEGIVAALEGAFKDHQDMLALYQCIEAIHREGYHD